MRQYNLPLLQKVRTVGRYDMPMLAKQDVTTPDTLMGFNYATGKKTVKHCGIHFFIDDYQFQRVWNQPDRYIAPLKRFQCVLTPDFGEATTREITNQNYQRSQKSLSKSVLRNMGY